MLSSETAHAKVFFELIIWKIKSALYVYINCKSYNYTSTIPIFWLKKIWWMQNIYKKIQLKYIPENEIYYPACNISASPNMNILMGELQCIIFLLNSGDPSFTKLTI